MIKWKNYSLLIGLAFVISFGFIFGGCSSEATPEQLQKIKDLEAEISSLEQSNKAKAGEKAELQNTINFIESKLKECEKEKQLVKDRLANWKDPVPEPVPVEQPTDKKSKSKKKTK